MDDIINKKMDEKIFSADDTFLNEDITQILYYFFDE